MTAVTDESAILALLQGGVPDTSQAPSLPRPVEPEPATETESAVEPEPQAPLVALDCTTSDTDGVTTLRIALPSGGLPEGIRVIVGRADTGSLEVSVESRSATPASEADSADDREPVRDEEPFRADEPLRLVDNGSVSPGDGFVQPLGKRPTTYGVASGEQLCIGPVVDERGRRLKLLSYEKRSAMGGRIRTNGDGNLLYQPKRSYSGPDFFTYQVLDRRGRLEAVAVNVSVGEPESS